MLEISGIHMLMLNNICLIDIMPTQQKGNHVRYWKPTQSHVVSKVMDFRKGSTTTTLLEQCNSFLYCKSYIFAHKSTTTPL